MGTFAERLKQLRLERELSLDMVCFDINQRFNLGLTKGQISRWENGKNIPTVRNAAYLAAYYNTSLDYLIGLTDVRTPRNIYSQEFLDKERAYWEKIEEKKN